MGNCQAAESAVVVIQHPDQKVVQRMYWSVTANVVMSSNPGYYVAHVMMIGSNDNNGNKNQSENVNSATTTSMATKKLKLLRPDDSLVLGQVYSLISFEDVLKNFAGNKCVKLKEGRCLNVEWNKHQSSTDLVKRYEMLNGAVRRHGGGGGQWKPVLQSIAERGAA